MRAGVGTRTELIVSVAMLLASACGPEIHDGTTAESGAAGESGNGTSTAGATSVADGMDASAADGGGPTLEDYEVLCGEQLDKAACLAVPATLEAEPIWCSWLFSVPVELDERTCTFGEPTGVCIVSRCPGVGCAGHHECGFDLPSATVDGKGAVLHTNVKGCFETPGEPCSFGPDSELVGGPPECACFCDPAFPAP